MGELETNEEFNLNTFLGRSNNDDDSVADVESMLKNTTISEQNVDSTDVVEYKEIEDPCVALTIIGENRLTDAEVFVKRGIKYSIKAFFSAIVLTIMNLFI